MRVLFINPVGTLGGAERVLLDALVAFRRQRPDLSATLLLLDPGPLVALAEATGASVRVVELPLALRTLGERAVSREAWRLLFDSSLARGVGSFVFAFRRAVAQVAPDIVHTNGFKAHFLAAALCGGTPSVLHAHDFLNGRPVSRRLVGLLQRSGLRVAANSRAVAAEYALAMPSTPVRTLYNAVNETEFCPGEPQRAPLAQLSGLTDGDEPSVVFGMVGTYARWKGQLLFLDAAARFAQRTDQRFRCYIVGGAQYSTRGSQFSETELRARIEELGLQQVVGLVPFQERVSSVYRALDVLVHPSTEPEPFGKSIVEGMASGLPVIAAAAGGSVELFDDGVSALGFRPRDADDLVDKMLTLARAPSLRRRIGEAARAEAVNRFGLERFGKELSAIYDELAPSEQQSGF